MNEKRKHKRVLCNVKVDFEFFEGNPDTVDPHSSVSLKGKGFMLDVSRGGAFLVSNSRLGINMPIVLKFKTKKRALDSGGIVIRTGLIKNNPSELAKKIAALDLNIKGDTYIAIQFDSLIDEISEDELK
jgi:hypothetical protein